MHGEDLPPHLPRPRREQPLLPGKGCKDEGCRDEGCRRSRGSGEGCLGTAALQMSRGDRGKWEDACQAYLLPDGKGCGLHGSLEARGGGGGAAALPGGWGSSWVGGQPSLANEPSNGTPTSGCRSPQPPSSHFSLINLKKGLKIIPPGQGGGSLGPPHCLASPPGHLLLSPAKLCLGKAVTSLGVTKKPSEPVTCRATLQAGFLIGQNTL